MSHASHAAHVQDLILDLEDLYLAQLTALREFARAPERAGQLEPALRYREQLRADLYRQFEQTAFRP